MSADSLLTPAIARQLGVGSWARSEALIAGRNENFLVTTPSGESLFVKRLTDSIGETERVAALLSADRHRCAAGWASFTPLLRAVDPDLGIVVYDAISGLGLAAPGVAQTLEGGSWAALGTLLARIHTARLDDVPAGSALADQFAVYSGYVDAISFDVFWHFTGAELALWSVIQSRSDSLLRTRAEIKEPPERVPTHGDIRLDQFIKTAQGPQLIDWERYCRGDPAQDLGMLLGDIFATFLYQDFDQNTAAHSTESEEFAQRWIHSVGVRATSAYAQIWRAYGQVATNLVTPAFIQRTGWILAWHLIERISSRAQYQSTLSGRDKGVLGIAIFIASAPTQAMAAFGIEGDDSDA
ncbi:phosphotransferase [Rathayibacter iranicus]|nr:phosphotransferase [Rathayibacter iranicus]MWV32045.1 phosphotransferase [Rathayibacter iranicus NCPPB 2253 = VKM Ac-1602]PWJ61988.1 phosphotransferase family enzyme [Rathayibacter iranicus NCPPB 2253 = VKM Ac-1602]